MLSAEDKEYSNIGYCVKRKKLEELFREKHCRSAVEDWTKDEIPSFAEKLGCKVFRRFSGWVEPIKFNEEDRMFDTIDAEPVEWIDIYLLPIPRKPNFFKAFYKSREEIVTDMMNTYGTCGLLPDSREEVWKGMRWINGRYHTDVNTTENCCIERYTDRNVSQCWSCKNCVGWTEEKVVLDPGEIDSNYRGSIRVKLRNHSDKPYLVHAGDKIAQIVVRPVSLASCRAVESLDDTDRGSGGFGSTGK